MFYTKGLMAIIPFVSGPIAISFCIIPKLEKNIAIGYESSTLRYGEIAKRRLLQAVLGLTHALFDSLNHIKRFTCT